MHTSTPTAEAREAEKDAALAAEALLDYFNLPPRRRDLEPARPPPSRPAPSLPELYRELSRRDGRLRDIAQHLPGARVLRQVRGLRARGPSFFVLLRRPKWAYRRPLRPNECS